MYHYLSTVLALALWGSFVGFVFLLVSPLLVLYFCGFTALWFLGWFVLWCFDIVARISHALRRGQPRRLPTLPVSVRGAGS